MNLESLKVEVGDIKQDIVTLETEVNDLNARHSELLEQLNLLQAELPSPNGPENGDSVEMDGGIAPDDAGAREIQLDRHFDPSIAKYFFFDAKTTPATSAKPASFHTVSHLTNQNILYENIFRFGGTTAFPINNHSPDELFGLRFDIYSWTSSTFVTPHYVILKKITVSNKQHQMLDQWTVFKHTLPSYVPYVDYEKLLHSSGNIDQFATSIRNFLCSVQYKHDKLQQLLTVDWTSLVSIKYKIISKIEKDLACNRVVIHLKRFQIEMLCSQSSIEIVNFSISNSTVDICKSILTDTKFTDLKKNFRRIITLLHENDLL
jgi:central kinetochore subunit Mal2/MCM21